MKIAIKGIFHERTEDAPFIGALICANDCNLNCEDCCNKHVKNYKTIYMNEDDIIKEVLKNKFNKGLILAGLEWSLQPKELVILIDKAIENDLEVIVYSGLSLEKLFEKIPELKDKNIYIKYGRYDKKNIVNDYYSNEVKLVTKNQNVVRYQK